MSANDHQIDGDHYVSTVQHWDFIEANGIGYLEGCASKYATRNRKKHGDPKKDLMKGMHYVEKLLELHRNSGRLNRRSSDTIPLDLFCNSNGLNDNETKVMGLLTYWTGEDDLIEAIHVLSQMLSLARLG